MDTQDKKIATLRQFYRQEKRMPSYSEMQKLFGYASKNACFYLVNQLIGAGLLSKDAKGRLRPVGHNFGLPLMGYVQAGFPSPAEEELVDTLTLDTYLIEKPEASFMLKVTGDSMIDAGIHPHDIVIIERGRDPKNGNIVLAEVDHEWTLKYYYKKRGGVELHPANPKYLVIRPKEELKIAGVIKGVVRKY